MRLLVVLSFIIFLIKYSTTTSAENYKPEQINCMVKYLKNLNNLANDFPELESTEVINCQWFMDQQARNLAKAIRKKFKKTLKGRHKKCIERHWNDNNVSELSLKSGIFKVLEIKFNRTLSEKVIENRDKINIEMEDVSLFCKFKHQYGKKFDEMTKNNKSEAVHKDLRTDYCKRVHLAENHYINTTLYSFPLNPMNISTTDINCGERIVKVIKEDEINFVDRIRHKFPRISKEVFDCKLNVFHDSDHFWISIKPLFLKEMNITEEVKQHEKRSFIIKMGRIDRMLNACRDVYSDESKEEIHV